MTATSQQKSCRIVRQPKNAKKEARDGAPRASGTRFTRRARRAPTGAEQGAGRQWRPCSANPRAGPIPVPKIAQKKKRETGIEPVPKIAQKKKRETGIEPATPTLARWCSTAEPLAHLSAPLTLITIHHLRTCVKRLSKVFRFVLIFCIVYTDLQI